MTLILEVYRAVAQINTMSIYSPGPAEPFVGHLETKELYCSTERLDLREEFRTFGRIVVVGGALGAEALAGACETSPYTQGHDCQPLREFPEAASRLFAGSTAASMWLGAEMEIAATGSTISNASSGLIFTITKA